VRAAIDVGTNTVRMLLGEVTRRRISPLGYYRRISRLGGGSTTEKGLNRAAMERTLEALREFAIVLRKTPPQSTRVVGTEALRKAPNAGRFAEAVRSETGLTLEIIDGDEEARLCALGVLSALSPRPEGCLIVDIGGGSTEFVLCRATRPLFRKSYPLGVVSLCESFPDRQTCQEQIDIVLDSFQADLLSAGHAPLDDQYPLVGTAGTVTTLAAIKLRMTEYDGERVNNLVLQRGELLDLARRLGSLSLVERESVPGMEKGRGDLIIPGLQIVLSLLERLNRDRLTVSDHGLLEGVLLAMDEEREPAGTGRN